MTSRSRGSVFAGYLDARTKVPASIGVLCDDPNGAGLLQDECELFAEVCRIDSYQR